MCLAQELLLVSVPQVRSGGCMVSLATTIAQSSMRSESTTSHKIRRCNYGHYTSGSQHFSSKEARKSMREALNTSLKDGTRTNVIRYGKRASFQHSCNFHTRELCLATYIFAQKSLKCTTHEIRLRNIAKVNTLLHMGK